MPDKIITSTGDCSACCGGGTGCSCSLNIPIQAIDGISKYTSYANAAAAISGYTNNCIGYITPAGIAITVTSFTASNAVANQLVLSSAESTGNTPFMVGSINLKLGAVVSVAYAITGPSLIFGASFYIYNCDGTLQQQYPTGISTHTGTIVFSAVPADGEYFFAGAYSAGAGHTGSFTLTSSINPMTVNPVIALWDNSGTTERLWACPKMFIPPLTEATATWYANSTAAATAISTLTSNCVGYESTTANVTTFTATDGGTSLTLALVLTANALNSPSVWGSVNAVGGQTLTFTWTTTVGGLPHSGQITLEIYNDLGVVVQSFPISGATNPLVSSALPYTGRYIIRANGSDTVSSQLLGFSVVITSSSTLTVNHITALWDDGLTCPARTDC